MPGGIEEAREALKAEVEATAERVMGVEFKTGEELWGMPEHRVIREILREHDRRLAARLREEGLREHALGQASLDAGDRAASALHGGAARACAIYANILEADDA